MLSVQESAQRVCQFSLNQWVYCISAGGITNSHNQYGSALEQLGCLAGQDLKFQSASCVKNLTINRFDICSV